VKKLLLIIFCAINVSAFGQKNEKISQDSLLKADIQNIKYCLSEYHQERQRAYSLGIFSLFCSATGTTLTLLNKNDRIGPVVAFSLSSVSFVASITIFCDSEKWLKRISLSPTSLKINF